MDRNFERKLFLYFCYDKVRNLSKWCPFCRRNASVSHLSDFDAYKEWRRGGLMGNVHVSGSSGPGSGALADNIVLCTWARHLAHSASLHPGV